MGRHSRLFIGVSVAVMALGAASAVFTSRKDTRTQAGRDAIFSAQQILEKELKALASAKPKTVAAKAEKTAEPESVAFDRFDVDAKLSGGVEGLKKVVAEFSGTRPAQDARLALGDLYYNHGEAAKAIPWYQAAVESASGGADKAFALYSLGYSLENSGKLPEAAQAYEKGVNLGEAALKGELMLALARAQDLTGDRAKAKTTLDQVIAQMPNTGFSKAAELRKSQMAE